MPNEYNFLPFIDKTFPQPVPKPRVNVPLVDFSGDPYQARDLAHFLLTVDGYNYGRISNAFGAGTIISVKAAQWAIQQNQIALWQFWSGWATWLGTDQGGFLPWNPELFVRVLVQCGDLSQRLINLYAFSPTKNIHREIVIAPDGSKHRKRIL